MGARAVNVAATARLWTCTWRPAGRSSRPLGSACFAPLDSLEVLGETVPGLCRALFHPGLEHAVAVLDGVVDGGGGERGLAVVLLEGQRLYRDVTGQALPLEGPHDALGPDDLAELAAEPVLLSLGLVHDPPRAAGPEV